MNNPAKHLRWAPSTLHAAALRNNELADNQVALARGQELRELAAFLGHEIVEHGHRPIPDHEIRRRLLTKASHQ